MADGREYFLYDTFWYCLDVYTLLSPLEFRRVAFALSIVIRYMYELGFYRVIVRIRIRLVIWRRARDDHILNPLCSSNIRAVEAALKNSFGS